MSEHDEQVTLFNIIRMYEDKYPVLKWVFAIPNGGHRHKATAAKMKAEGVKAGVWDVFVPVPRIGKLSEGVYDSFSGMFIEMKFGKNGLTNNQKDFESGIGKTFKFAVCYSGIEAANVIFEYLGISERVQG